MIQVSRSEAPLESITPKGQLQVSAVRWKRMGSGICASQKWCMASLPRYLTPLGLWNLFHKMSLEDMSPVFLHGFCSVNSQGGPSPVSEQILCSEPSDLESERCLSPDGHRYFWPVHRTTVAGWVLNSVSCWAKCFACFVSFCGTNPSPPPRPVREGVLTFLFCRSGKWGFERSKHKKHTFPETHREWGQGPRPGFEAKSACFQNCSSHHALVSRKVCFTPCAWDVESSLQVQDSILFLTLVL